MRLPAPVVDYIARLFGFFAFIFVMGLIAPASRLAYLVQHGKSLRDELTERGVIFIVLFLLSYMIHRKLRKYHKAMIAEQNPGKSKEKPHAWPKQHDHHPHITTEPRGHNDAGEPLYEYRNSMFKEKHTLTESELEARLALESKTWTDVILDIKCACLICTLGTSFVIGIGIPLRLLRTQDDGEIGQAGLIITIIVASILVGFLSYKKFWVVEKLRQESQEERVNKIREKSKAARDTP